MLDGPQETTRAIREALWAIRMAAALVAADGLGPTERRAFCDVIEHHAERVRHLTLARSLDEAQRASH